MTITSEELRSAVTHEVRQQLTAYVLQMSLNTKDVEMIKWTLYGNEMAGEAGIVKSVKSMSVKLDTLIDLGHARENQWKGIKAAFVVVGAISSIPAIQVVLPIVQKIIGAVNP